MRITYEKIPESQEKPKDVLEPLRVRLRSKVWPLTPMLTPKEMQAIVDRVEELERPLATPGHIKKVRERFATASLDVATECPMCKSGIPEAVRNSLADIPKLCDALSTMFRQWVESERIRYAEKHILIEEIAANAETKRQLVEDLVNTRLALERLLGEACEELRGLRKENEELESIFKLRCSADRRAIERWRAAAPGRELRSPDQTDLCVWIMEQLEAAQLSRVEWRSRAQNDSALAELRKLIDPIAKWVKRLGGTCLIPDACPIGTSPEWLAKNDHVTVGDLRKLAAWHATDYARTAGATGKATRNSTVLTDFVAYCEANPSQCFWQALRNWSGARLIRYQDFKEVPGTNGVDTFNWEGKKE